MSAKVWPGCLRIAREAGVPNRLTRSERPCQSRERHRINRLHAAEIDENVRIRYGAKRV